jgi:predicted RNA-binding protein with PUA-like domain
MARFLLKTEPNEYSFDDLERERHTAWDGVTNALALKHIRAMREGDDVVIYHTGDEKKVVGLARVIRAPYLDAKAKDPKAALVDVIVGKRFPRPVSLAEMKENPSFSDFDLLRLPRLSVVPMAESHWTALMKLTGMISRR